VRQQLDERLGVPRTESESGQAALHRSNAGTFVRKRLLLLKSAIQVHARSRDP
jgi:hypothetical protein